MGMKPTSVHQQIKEWDTTTPHEVRLRNVLFREFYTDGTWLDVLSWSDQYNEISSGYYPHYPAGTWHWRLSPLLTLRTIGLRSIDTLADLFSGMKDVRPS